MTFAEIMARVEQLKPTMELTAYNMAKMRADSYNNELGGRNLEDGYDCPICKNKGRIAKVVVENGNAYMRCVDCRCEAIRKSIMRLKRSGLESVIKSYTFDRYETKTDWQKEVKAAAMEYAKNPRGWFFFGGQSGSGKTHICTAICRQLILDGYETRYMLWRDEIQRLKANITDEAAYRTVMNMYKMVPVLYIDDLFKTGAGTSIEPQRPTGADVNIAFELLNHRYNNHMITIISSECTANELLDIDEAVAGRIMESAKAFSIRKDRGKNYRLRKIKEI